jgi:hypothetical protein
MQLAGKRWIRCFVVTIRYDDDAAVTKNVAGVSRDEGPLARSAWVAGREKTSFRKVLDVLLPFDDVHRTLPVFVQVGEPIEHATRPFELPDPAPCTVGAALSELLAGFADDLEEQLPAFVSVPVRRLDLVRAADVRIGAVLRPALAATVHSMGEQPGAVRIDRPGELLARAMHVFPIARREAGAALALPARHPVVSAADRARTRATMALVGAYCAVHSAASLFDFASMLTRSSRT